MAATVFDRILARLVPASEVARRLSQYGPSMPCPLESVLRACARDEFEALELLVDSARNAGHGPYRHEGLGEVPPPVRRLLQHLTAIEAGIPDGTDRAKRALDAHIRAADGEAFTALSEAVAAERTSRSWT